MLINYLKIVFCNFWKRKLFFGINLLGLGIVIVVSLFFFLIILYEFSFDRFYENVD